MALGPITDPGFKPQQDVDGRAHLDGFSFVRPVSSFIYPGLPLRSTMNPTIGYVSTDPLRNRCIRTAEPGGDIGETCGSELDALTGPHGVFLRWIRLGMPNQKMAELPGGHVTLAGRDARWARSVADSSCAAQGGTTSVTATVLAGSSNMVDDMVQVRACLVSADDVPVVRAVVDSLRFDNPETPEMSNGATQTSTVGDLTFTHDKLWQLRTYGGPAIPTASIYTYVSAEPVDEQCLGKSANVAPCGEATSHLKAHEVFATWRQMNQPGLRFDDAKGERVIVDGRPASWSVGEGGSCGASGGTTSVVGRILHFSQDGGDELALLSACLVSPDELSAAKAMFESVRFP